MVETILEYRSDYLTWQKGYCKNQGEQKGTEIILFYA